MPRPRTNSSGHVDGRALRSERSREAIVVAMIDLVGAGNLSPKAEQIAERARVGLRTVFRHFGDLDSIFAAMAARVSARVFRDLGVQHPAGPLARRIGDLARRRARFFEMIAPYKRAEMLSRWQSAFLRGRHAALVRRLRAENRHWLPELDAADAALVNAVELALSFEAWDRLRSDQKLTTARAVAVIERTVAALLRGGADRRHSLGSKPSSRARASSWS